MNHAEVGRELKVSELRTRTVVVLQKGEEATAATIWVVGVFKDVVHFRAGAVGLELFLFRTGPDLDQLCDDTGARIIVYEYLGKV
jgi:hypothetical protein